MSEEILYRADLDASGVESTLNDILKELQQINARGQAAFDGVEGASKKTGVSIGAVSGITQELVSRLIELGKRGVEALAQIAAKGIELNRNLETAKVTFAGIFGDADTADRFVEHLRRVSTELNVGTEEAAAFARSIVPDASSLDEFDKILRAGAILASSAPGKGLDDATRSFKEALSGQFESLRENFDIPPDVIDRIKQTGEEIGIIPALIQELDQHFERSGLSIENFADTFDTAVRQSKSKLGDLQTFFGEPLFDVAKESLQEFNQFLSENEPLLRAIAGAAGDVLAALANVAKDDVSGLTDGLDLERLLGFIQRIEEGILLFQSLTEQIRTIPSGLAPFIGGLDTAKTSFLSINDAVRSAIQILAIFNGALVGAQTTAVSLGEGLAAVARGEIGFEEAINRAVEAGKGAMKEIVDSAVADLDRIDQRVAQQKTDFNQRAGGGGDDEIPFDNTKQGADEATDSLEELAAAAAKVDEAFGDLDRDEARAKFDLQLEQTRKLIDLEEELSRAREDAARKNREKIADIVRENGRDIEQAVRDLAREEADIARDAARERAQIEDNLASARIQAEVDYQRRLADIRSQFSADAEEAARANDAIQFLRAQRRAENEAQTAEETRQRDIEDAERAAEERRRSLEKQLQQEIADAQTANERKLEDLRNNLNQQLEDQAIAYAREQEALARNEEQKRAQLQKEFAREREDFARQWARRHADLERELQTQLKLAQKYKQLIQNELSDLAATSSTRRRRGGGDEDGRTSSSSKRRSDSKGAGNIKNNLRALGVEIAGMRGRGGQGLAGSTYLTGETGPELVKPKVNSEFIPLDRLVASNQPARGMGGSTYNRTSNQVDLSMLDPNSFTPTQMAIIQSFVNDAILRALGT